MASRGEVAIVGYASRLPGARNTDAFWQLLRANRCSVDWISADRFPTQPFYHPSANQRGRSYTFAAGLIDDVWGFDAAAFGMSPREAEQVDPQQRHLLEVTHDALTHAGIRPSSLAGGNVGVYVGASSVDYGTRFIADPSSADVHMMTGNTLSVIANRLSYNLDLHGPSFTVDTACSSSLVALDLASEAIRSGTVDTAIVAGVNLLLSPFSFVGFSRASMLSPTGRCRPFDASADGYVRAEGVIVLVLRSPAAAHRERNRIHAVVVGSAVGQDGRTTGLSLPSADSQRRLLEQVYDDFGIDPADLMYVEAHGTGTRVGDPMEADALGKGLAQRRTQPLPIGSVKSNIGHLEPASGLAGVLKAVLALKHGIIPATLHQTTPSPDIPFDELNLRVIDKNWRLPARRGSTLIGVNSFGFGGTNAHVVLRGEETVVSMVQARVDDTPPPLMLSTHTVEALEPLASAYLKAWPSDRRSATDLVVASAHLRDALPHRVIVRGQTTDEIRHNLERFVSAGVTPPAVLKGRAIGTELPVAFLFAGNGSQWAGMGRTAWHENACFREALTEADTHFAKRQDWSLVDMLFGDDLVTKLRHATYAQPLLLGLQVATVRALEDAGVVPSAVAGHSVGEIAAAWTAGILSLEQAIDVVIARSRHQEVSRGSGGMAALMLGERDARQFLRNTAARGVEVAAINSWRSVTIAGPVTELDRLVAEATRAKISARRLDLDYPFHSALVDQVRAPLLRELEGLRTFTARRRFISSVSGEACEGEALGADHWWNNVREPVRFQAALDRLIQDGVRVFVEVGPKPILTSYVRDALREADIRGAIVETLNEGEDRETADPIEIAVSKVLLAGGRVDLQRFFGPAPAIATPLPFYPWQHSRYEVRPTPEASNVFTAPEHALLGSRPRQNSSEWFSTIDPVLFPWIADHKVEGIPVFPAAAYLEVLLAAAREVFGEGPLELRDLDIVRPLVFDSEIAFETSVRLSPETGLTELLSRQRGGSDWVLNARGIVGRSPVAAMAPVVAEIPAGTVVVPKSKVYEAAASLGFGYGELFQRVRHAEFPDPKCSVATLESRDGCFETHVVDLTAIDAAFHTLFASEEAGVADTALTRMLPIRFGRIRVFVPGVAAARAIARTVRRSATSILADIDLLDAAGTLVVSIQGARLIEAPSSSAPHPGLLTYTTLARRLDRAGAASVLRLPPDRKHLLEAGEVAEALLLLEAGALRAAWTVFSRSPGDTSATDMRARHLRSALLWHLEARGLAAERDGQLFVVEDCPLPDVAAVVRSLLARHPTMTSEAASLSRLEEILERFLRSENPEIDLSSSHWRTLGQVSAQVDALRREIAEQVEAALSRSSEIHLHKLLLIGADHFGLAIQLVAKFPTLDVVITDIDPDRLDHARASLGDDESHIRCAAWHELESLAPNTFDIACAVDALSHVATHRDGLARLQHLLRPGAPLLAGELGPSVFWDVVRGLRADWWARSANAEFPVGALLTAQEWRDELNHAGFASIETLTSAENEGIGTILRSVAPSIAAYEASGASTSIAWEGQSTDRIEAIKTGFNAGDQLREIVWGVAGQGSSEQSTDERVKKLGEQLAALAQRCRTLTSVERLSLLVDLGTSIDFLADPIWRAVSAAMRVAQNEYPDLLIRCLGIADGALLRDVAAELTTPSDEFEVIFTREGRIVLRIERGLLLGKIKPQRQHNEAIQLVSRSVSTRGQLNWTNVPRRTPKVGEVEIAVATTGVNFRDVMWNLGLLPEEALEDGYAGATLGMECAGTVTAIGTDVGDLAVGDRVVAFASGAFASHVIVPAFAVSPLPANLTFEAAATLPVAFLTAYYSLVHLAHLNRGETVLIHGGAGAVGLAALQVARHCGATVIATAGSEEKRALLRDLGAELVLNSRTLSFADEVRDFTAGKGVDVVLNSLAGEAMIRSMDCLRPFGRFIELGKRDFYANTHLGLRPFRRNLTYFGVDIDQLLGEHQELMKRLFGELIRHFATGEFIPLPYRQFAGEEIADAFRLMQRSGHIGKVIVVPAAAATEPATQSVKFPVSETGLHIVIGGTRGFGLTTAEWLADRGATQLALISRSGVVSDAAASTIETLRQRGVEIEVAAVDVADAAALGRYLKSVRRPIKGIVHAAMVLDDRLIEGMDHTAIHAALRPKVAGALNLERYARDLQLDYLLYYSSATTLIGNPGQFNYVAANAFMEGIARRGQAEGLPVLAVAWGGIEDSGYLAEHLVTNTSLRKRFASSLLPARAALDGLDFIWGARSAGSVAFARIDWAMVRRDLAVVRAPVFDAVRPASGSRQAGDSAAILEKLKAMSPEHATDALLDVIVDEIARVLRLPAKEVDRHRALAEIGMDSLMMLELRTTVEETLQIDLPMMSLASGTTPADVARRIVPLLFGETRTDSVPGNLAAMAASHFVADAEAVDVVGQQAAARNVLERARKHEGPI